MDEISIGCIVEGHGETRALPELLRRIAADLSIWHLAVPPPQRVTKAKLLLPGVLENAVQAMALRVPGAGVLVLLDADDDCPATLGPEPARRARAARPDRKVSVVLAKMEFEAWFLAAAASLSGRRGLPEALMPPTDPECVRGAKEWLDYRMTGQSYRETVDQAALAAVFDLAAARQNSPSFDKFCREARRLLER
jgi:hypothetical protein